MKNSPRYFFLNIASIISLYVSAGSLIALLFQVIDHTYPDAAVGYYDPYSAAIRIAIASLVVAFPLFLFFSWMVTKDQKREPERRQSPLRKWLLFFTLFVAGAIVAGDTIALINSFLSGELTTRFLLKVLTLAVVLGLIFSYYLYEIRKASPEKTKTVWVFEAAAIVVVVGSLIIGFAVLGSPATQRSLRLDSERVNDLSSIQYQVLDYWQRTEELPQSLDELEENALAGYIVPTDPETGEPYTYEVTGDLTFNLCATFELPSREARPGTEPYYPDFLNENWQHDAGLTCFERTIDPELNQIEEVLINRKVPTRI